MSNRSKLVSALTQWDSKQSANPRVGHNPYFLGIALGAIEDMPDANQGERELRERIARIGYTMNDTEKKSNVLDAIRLIAGMDEAWTWDVGGGYFGKFCATLTEWGTERDDTGCRVINRQRYGWGDTPEEAIAKAIKEMRK